jgi:type VI secretion system secreted protein Hcp
MENIFWTIEGIKGESLSDQGKDKIELLSFSHGVAMPLTNGPSNTSRASGRCVHQDFTVTKRLDIASPSLNLKCCGGEDIKQMKIHVWKADLAAQPVEYLTYTFDSCILTSISVGGAADQPIETITFNYKKITWDYNKQKQDQPGGKVGTASAYWDLDKNTGK